MFKLPNHENEKPHCGLNGLRERFVLNIFAFPKMVCSYTEELEKANQTNTWNYQTTGKSLETTQP